MPGKEEPPAAWILSKSSTVSLHSMSERSNVDSGNLSSLSAKPTVYATSPAVVTKLHVCYRICRWLMPCWSQAQIHEIDQSLHSFHNQVADMVEGETALHHYPEGDKMKAKYRGHEGVVVLDEETGETIDIVDNKNPSPEEIAHYKLAQVASKPVDFQESLDFFAHHDSESQRESGDVAKLSSSSGPGELPKRRITWRRTDSMDDIPQGGLVYKRPSKVDKSVRIFPLVRITIVENMHNYFGDADALADKERWALEDVDAPLAEPLAKSDLWFSRKEMKAFKANVMLDNEMDGSLKMMHKTHKNALLWYQTFGKFHGECGEEFSDDHEQTLFDGNFKDMKTSQKNQFYWDAQHNMMVSGTPFEYAKWEAGDYLDYMGGEERNHADFVQSIRDLPSHDDWRRVHKADIMKGRPLIHAKSEARIERGSSRSMGGKVGGDHVDENVTKFMTLGMFADLSCTNKQLTRTTRKLILEDLEKAAGSWVLAKEGDEEKIEHSRHATYDPPGAKRRDDLIKQRNKTMRNFKIGEGQELKMDEETGAAIIFEADSSGAD